MCVAAGVLTLSIKEGESAEVCGEETGWPLDSGLNGTWISRECTTIGQRIGSVQRGSTLKDLIARRKPDITTEKPLGPQLPPFPTESVAAEDLSNPPQRMDLPYASPRDRSL